MSKCEINKGSGGGSSAVCWMWSDFFCHSSVPGLGREGGFLWDWHNWNAISCHRAYSGVYYEFTGKALKFKWSLAWSFFFFFNLQRNAGFSFCDCHITKKKKKKETESWVMWWRVEPPKPKSTTKTVYCLVWGKNKNYFSSSNILCSFPLNEYIKA